MMMIPIPVVSVQSTWIPDAVVHVRTVACQIIGPVPVPIPFAEILMVSLIPCARPRVRVWKSVPSRWRCESASEPEYNSVPLGMKLWSNEDRAETALRVRVRMGCEEGEIHRRWRELR